MEFDLSQIKLTCIDKEKGLILPKRVSRELSYLCGILVGDGSIYTRQDKNDYIIKCVGNPKDEQELYHKIIGPYFKRVFGFIPIIKYQDSNRSYGFVLYSKSLFTYLTEIIGLLKGRKNHNLGIPTIFKKG